MPRATKRDQTIPLGIVGGGLVWDARYRAAVSALTRGKVTAVFSPQVPEGETLAHESGGKLFCSLRTMLDEAGVRAILILETGWSREWAISLAIARQIPVYVAVPIDEHLPRIAPGLVNQEAEGAVVVPGVLLRATPAALRLRELIATKLGAVQELAVELPASEPTDSLVISAIDWCRSLLGSTVSQITREPTPDGQLLVMSCGRRTPLSPPVRTEIRMPATAATSAAPPVGQLIARVRCQKGHAELIGESHLHWQTDTESADESLESDRPAEQVLLDLFLRRVVGGVVPIPSWAELQEASRLWGSVKEVTSDK